MATCKTRRFPREKICAGDLRHRISIEKRTHLEPEPGQSVGVNSFQVIKRTYSGIKTLTGLFGGTARFDGVNVEDRPTHMFTVRKDNSILLPELSNYFVRYNSRLFRILRAAIKDEDTNLIDISATERGVDSQEANEA